MGTVISLLNHKGGVGKTTSAINIGAAMVELGKRVLLIDLDPQANLTISLGIPRQKTTIYEALRGEGELTPYTHKPMKFFSWLNVMKEARIEIKKKVFFMV